MRQLSAEARLHFVARSLSHRARRGMQGLALYASLALIAAVIIRSLSSHPL